MRDHTLLPSYICPVVLVRVQICTMFTYTDKKNGLFQYFYDHKKNTCELDIMIVLSVQTVLFKFKAPLLKSGSLQLDV